LLFGVLVVVAMIGQSTNQIWASPDFWVHLGAVREFAHSLLHPANPLVIGGAHDPYMSPYAFVLGATVRVTSLDAVTVLTVAGIANLVLLLFAIRRFVQLVSSAEFAPVLSLLFVLTAWGIGPWRWSGFFSLNSLGTVLPLSSTFASAVGLLTIVALCTWLRHGDRRQLIAVAVGGVLVVLCHPLTATWVALVGLGFVISEMRPSNLRRRFALGAVVVCAGLIAAVWPFFSIIRTLQKSESFDATNAALYHGVAQRSVLALPGFVLLVTRFVRRHRDPLALGAAFNIVVYVAGLVSGHRAFGRVLPGIMLMAQVAMGIFVAELLCGRRSIGVRTKRATAVGVATIVIVGVIGSAAGVVRVIPRAWLPQSYAHKAQLASLVAPYASLDDIIDRDDVVVASRPISLAVAATSGKVIAPSAPAPFVDDTQRRSKAVVALLSPKTTPARFLSLLRQYRVRWFVVVPSDATRLRPRIQSGTLALVGSRTGFRIFRVVVGP
jgi:hypothetical protein